MKAKRSGGRYALAGILILTLSAAASAFTAAAQNGESIWRETVPVISKEETQTKGAEPPGWDFLPCPDRPACLSEEADEPIRAAKNGECVTAYDEEALYWLSRIIHAEAGSEPFRGKLAVGCVVMNRVASPEYPDTVYEVIFDIRYGVQFTPVFTGSIYAAPDSESITAAKACLGGYSLSDSILFFQNEALATSTWTKENRPYVMTVGNHDFYS